MGTQEAPVPHDAGLKILTCVASHRPGRFGSKIRHQLSRQQSRSRLIFCMRPLSWNMHSRMRCSPASLSRMHFPLRPSRFPMQRTYMSASILIMPTSYSWLHSYVSSIIPWNQIMRSIFSRVHGSASFVRKLRNAVWRPSRSQLVPLTHQS